MPFEHNQIEIYVLWALILWWMGVRFATLRGTFPRLTTLVSTVTGMPRDLVSEPNTP
jgi:hypothetical protein